MNQGKLILLLLPFSISWMAFSQSDTSAYQVQRRKINQLLAERSNKFGRYDQSLSMRTGIFGFKTKRDMQRSNDILTEVVRTDNDIFKELKILLDYKDYEKSSAENKAVETESRIDRYTQTITKLQQQNDRLKSSISKLEKQQNNASVLMYLFLLIAATLGILLYRAKKLTKY